MLYATMIMLLIALPAFFLAGSTGAFLHSAALASALAIVASMFVALTVTPALGVMLLPSSPLDGNQSAIVAQLQHGYGSALSRLVENPRPAFLAACVIALGGLAMLLTLDRGSFIPTLQGKRPGRRSRGLSGHLASGDEPASRVRPPASCERSPAFALSALTSDAPCFPIMVDDVNTGELWVSLDRDADYDATVTGFSRSWTDMPASISTPARISKRAVDGNASATRSTTKTSSSASTATTGKSSAPKPKKCRRPSAEINGISQL